MNEREAVDKILEKRMQQKVESVAAGMYDSWVGRVLYGDGTGASISLAMPEFHQLRGGEREMWIAAAKYAIAYRDTL